MFKMLPKNMLEESHHDDPEEGKWCGSEATWEFV